MLAVRAACARLGSERLVGYDLYVTLEPCAMCAAVISFARLRRLYFGAGDPKMGAVEHGPRLFAQPTCHHAPEIYGGIGEAEARALMVDSSGRAADAEVHSAARRRRSCISMAVPRARLRRSRAGSAALRMSRRRKNSWTRKRSTSGSI